MLSVANEYDPFDWVHDDGTGEGDGDGGEGEGGGGAAEAEEALALLEQYKELGSPDEILELFKSTKEELAALKAKVGDGDKKTPAKPRPGNLTEEQATAIRQDLLTMFPELNDISKIKEVMSEVAEKTDYLSHKDARAIAKQAGREVTKLMEKSGYDTDGASFIEDVVANRIYSDPKLLMRLNEGDLDVVQEVFADTEKRFLSKHVVRKAKKLSQEEIHALLSGKAGKAVAKEKTAEQLKEEESANPSDRLRKIGKDAFEYYQEVVNALHG